MFKRLLQLPIDKNDSLFVFGPRGTGKTSWLQYHIPPSELLYLDLLDSLIFRKLTSRPESLREFIKPNFSGWIVIDEVQKTPAILDEVHRLIEEKNIVLF